MQYKLYDEGEKIVSLNFAMSGYLAQPQMWRGGFQYSERGGGVDIPAT